MGAIPIGGAFPPVVGGGALGGGELIGLDVGGAPPPVGGALPPPVGGGASGGEEVMGAEIGGAIPPVVGGAPPPGGCALIGAAIGGNRKATWASAGRLPLMQEAHENKQS